MGAELRYFKGFPDAEKHAQWLCGSFSWTYCGNVKQAPCGCSTIKSDSHIRDWGISMDFGGTQLVYNSLQSWEEIILEQSIVAAERLFSGFSNETMKTRPWVSLYPSRFTFSNNSSINWTFVLHKCIRAPTLTIIQHRDKTK